MVMKRYIAWGVLIVLVGLCCVSCLAGTLPEEKKPAGFWMGIWHGWIAPIALIGRLFNSEIRIYESFNTGWWYDFGYYMAIISGFGGLSLARRKPHHRKAGENDSQCSIH
ncbi:MAG: hypothetical protein GX104_11520 [Spirochaetales bacterium]|jgi:hypothetical protein|nr:hypothetical protein [Spirochaetales bacterium]